MMLTEMDTYLGSINMNSLQPCNLIMVNRSLWTKYCGLNRYQKIQQPVNQRLLQAHKNAVLRNKRNFAVTLDTNLPQTYRSRLMYKRVNNKEKDQFTCEIITVLRRLSGKLTGFPFKVPKKVFLGKTCSFHTQCCH